MFTECGNMSLGSLFGLELLRYVKFCFEDSLASVDGRHRSKSILKIRQTKNEYHTPLRLQNRL